MCVDVDTKQEAECFPTKSCNIFRRRMNAPKRVSVSSSPRRARAQLHVVGQTSPSQRFLCYSLLALRRVGCTTSTTPINGILRDVRGRHIRCDGIHQSKPRRYLSVLVWLSLANRETRVLVYKSVPIFLFTADLTHYIRTEIRHNVHHVIAQESK